MVYILHDLSSLSFRTSQGTRYLGSHTISGIDVGVRIGGLGSQRQDDGRHLIFTGALHEF